MFDDVVEVSLDSDVSVPSAAVEVDDNPYTTQDAAVRCVHSVLLLHAMNLDMAKTCGQPCLLLYDLPALPCCRPNPDVLEGMGGGVELELLLAEGGTNLTIDRVCKVWRDWSIQKHQDIR